MSALSNHVWDGSNVVLGGKGEGSVWGGGGGGKKQGGGGGGEP